jgi:hypothetical protein
MSEPELKSPLPRCPLCRNPLTRSDPDDRDNTGVRPEVAALSWAGCPDCNILSPEPYVEWHAFKGEREH